jgi:hypothetical protein
LGINTKVRGQRLEVGGWKTEDKIRSSTIVIPGLIRNPDSFNDVKPLVAGSSPA